MIYISPAIQDPDIKTLNAILYCWGKKSSSSATRLENSEDAKLAMYDVLERELREREPGARYLLTRRIFIGRVILQSTKLVGNGLGIL